MLAFDFFLQASAGSILPLQALAKADPLEVAEPVTAQILPEGEGTTAMLGFMGSTPGPELRARQGEQFDIDVQNRIEEGSAVHWHGARRDDNMDGVPVMTQDLIEPGDEKEYSFAAPDAATIWYHSHQGSAEQVARGTRGPLIVEMGPPDVDHGDLTVLPDWWIIHEDGVLSDEFTNMSGDAHRGYLGNFARASLSPVEEVAGDDRVRSRVINAATDRIFPLGRQGVDGTVVGLDGMTLVSPRQPSDLTLAPAQRADHIMDATSPDPVGFGLISRDGRYFLPAHDVFGSNTARWPFWIVPLLPNLADEPDAKGHVTLTMGTEDTPLHPLPQAGMMSANIWAFNFLEILPDAPFHSPKRGETHRIQLYNDTGFPHGIHLHGHHFAADGADGSLGFLRDTTLVPAGEQRDLNCVFDNPGRWLVHCHMLGMALGGMDTWVPDAPL
nr:multicopper oxidase [uncultured bacterium]